MNPCQREARAMGGAGQHEGVVGCSGGLLFTVTETMG